MSAIMPVTLSEREKKSNSKFCRVNFALPAGLLTKVPTFSFKWQ
jgi:hypothetical protein